MLRFLHCADLHLDTPHTLADLENAASFRDALHRAFSSMMLYIRQHDVRLALLAGDLFSHAFVTRETAALLRRSFAEIPQCQFVIAPGNHDFYADDSLYAQTTFPENVHIFRDASLSLYTCTIPMEDGTSVTVEVFGFAHTAPEPEMAGWNPFDHLTAETAAQLRQPPAAGRHRVFLGHADIRGTSKETPQITREQLTAYHFDYAALGHYHTSDGIRRTGCLYFGYPGCMVGRGYDETGFRGAVCGTLDFDADGKSVLTVRRLRIGKRHFETLTIDTGSYAARGILTEKALAAELARETAQAAEDGRLVALDENTALKLTLIGSLPADIPVTERVIRSALPTLSELVLDDRTDPCPTDALTADPTLRGAYCRALDPALRSDSEVIRETAALALRLGLQAL